MTWSYSEDRKCIIIDPPKQTLRITGHRMAGVLGLDKYSSPFKCWAEITKLVKPPFEDTKYTLFGKAVEPKLIKMVAEKFPNVMSMEEYYGNNLDKYRWNNFQDESKIFGGIFDAVSTKSDMMTITTMIECKTSSRPQDWEPKGTVKIEYLLQGCEYAYLKGVDKVLFICAFAKDAEYAHPELFEPTEENTIMVVKRVSDVLVEMPDGNYLTFEEVMEYCEKWWKTFVETGISPEFDPVKDKEYLDIIRKSKPTEDNDLITICTEAANLAVEIQALKISSGLNDKEKELKVLEGAIKDKMVNDGIEVCGKYSCKRTSKIKFDEKRFAEENEKSYNEYCEEVVSYTLSKNLKEE